jgi:hypothetical protein
MRIFIRVTFVSDELHPRDVTLAYTKVGEVYADDFA